MAKRAYAFADEATLDKVIRFVSDPINFLAGSFGISQKNILNAKVTEVISDTEVKAIQVIRQSDGNTTDYPNGLTFDDDADQDQKNNVPNLITYEGFKFSVDQIVEVLLIPFEDGAKFVGFPPSAGSERPFVTSPITGQQYGGTYDFPGGTLTPFTEQKAFWIVTPWGSRVPLPTDELVAGYQFFADVISGAYHYLIKDIYVKPLQNYPAGDDISQFQIYFARSDSSLKLGGTAGGDPVVPAGSKVKHEGFDNANAGTPSLQYYSNKVFNCSYDPVQNLFLIDHPLFGT